MPNANNFDKVLSNHIYNAFCEDHLYPGDEKIVRDKFPPSMPDQLEIFNINSEKKWHELDDEFFMSHGTIQFSIAWLTLNAIYYYLPSFMRYIIGPSWGDNNAVLLDKLLEVIYPHYSIIMNLRQFGASISHQIETDAKKEFESFGINNEKIKVINEFLSYLFESERYKSSVKYLDKSAAIEYWV